MNVNHRKDLLTQVACLQVEKALVPRSAATQQVFADLIDVQERILSNGAATESSDSGPQNNPHGNGFRQTQDHTANLRCRADWESLLLEVLASTQLLHAASLAKATL